LLPGTNDPDGSGRPHESLALRHGGAADWTLRDLVCAPPEIDPAIHRSGWAWATGPNGERLQGDGDSPNDALVTLIVKPKGPGQ
jgi:hypothetical protein